MKVLILGIAIILSACVEAQVHKFEIIECTNSILPEFDGQVVSLIDSNTGEILKDTLVEKVEKTRNIFKPCRQYIYTAIYRDKNNNVISDSKIWMMSTGRRWEYQPEKQDEVVVQFAFSKENIPEIKKHYVNKKILESITFSDQTTTGIIENVKEVWMHPFRSNQYNFTEVAAFPHVKYPLEIGKTWTS